MTMGLFTSVVNLLELVPSPSYSHFQWIYIPSSPSIINPIVIVAAAAFYFYPPVLYVASVFTTAVAAALSFLIVAAAGLSSNIWTHLCPRSTRRFGLFTSVVNFNLVLSPSYFLLIRFLPPVDLPSSSIPSSSLLQLRSIFIFCFVRFPFSPQAT